MWRGSERKLEPPVDRGRSRAFLASAETNARGCSRGIAVDTVGPVDREQPTRTRREPWESIVRHALSRPAGICKATEGKREWDSPSAMLKPCARVLAFPAVYRLATDTLVHPLRSVPPSLAPATLFRPRRPSGTVLDVRSPSGNIPIPIRRVRPVIFNFMTPQVAWPEKFRGEILKCASSDLFELLYFF